MSDLIRRLREENEALREEVRQLRKALRPEIHFPLSWGLSPQEQALLSALRVSSPRLLTLDRAMTALYATDDPPATRFVRILLSRLRRKLANTGLNVTIENTYCRGCRLAPEGCALIDSAIAADLAMTARAA